MTGRSALPCTLLSAACYGLAFPPLGWHLVAWVTLAPFFLALRGAGVLRVIGLGVVWGVVAAYSVGTWMPVAVTRYYAQPASVGVAVFLICALVTVAPYTVLFALLYRRVARYGGAAGVLLGAAAWTASELLRAVSPAGNPWALVGYALVPAPPLVQIAEVTGVFGVCFAVAAVNAALAQLVAMRRELDARTRAAERAGARRGLLAAAGVVALVLAYGAARSLGTADGATAVVAADDGAPVPVAVIQGNLDLGSQWRPELYGENLEAYLRSTDAALARRPARLVVWPENALTFFLEDEPAYRRAIARVLAAHDAVLLTGGPRVAPGASPREPRYLNAAFVLTPAGEVHAVYEKQYLVPFAEYFPLPAQGALRRRFGRVREFSVGARHDPLPTPAGAAGVLICNEALYGDVARDRVRRGAELLVNLSNDGWVGAERYAAIVFEMSRLRAIETRRWLVRSSTSGPSALIDPRGRVVAYAALDERSAIDADVVPRRELTPYVRFGDLFGWACAVVALAAAVRRA
ncbi:MAG TPA: apolipoprotein N-acyltransferase [Candidatus Binatia bacterium]